MDCSTKQAVYELFNSLEIPYKTFDHPPIFSQADNEKHRIDIGAVIFKNLFLQNSGKTHYYLYSLPISKRADLIKLRELLDESRLSFGDENKLLEKLNIRPGSVSFLNVIKNPKTDVIFLIDKEIFNSELFGVHPNDNTSTIVFAPNNISTILDHFKVEYRFI
ncbi:MAG: prolyl-tRNA synthetase associated domain-containing protein [Christensenellaceae bacterium]|nr:prolyl-tRNA synthetase associated domain-containing protein [Christensenellaceae bacterium]